MGDDQNVTTDPETLSHFHSSRLSFHECIAVQHAIDAEIDAIPPESPFESIRTLNARRNAYALINVWLPPELMAAIFYEFVVSSQGMYQKGGFQTRGFSQQFIAISQVCQVWRAITISTPRLWEGISVANPDVTTLMLHRSKASPISIVYHLFNNETSNALPLALAHSDRAFEIDLVVLPVLIQNVISKYLTKPMPFLKRLKVHTGFVSTPPPPACILPPGCLEGANVLNHLDLMQVGFSPASNLPATLTVLTLVLPPERLTVSQMIDLLEPLENLRDLCIECALRLDDPDTIQPSAVRRLSPRTHLVQLRLNELARERGDFMSRYPITPKTQISLLCNAERLEDNHFGQVLKPVYGARGLLRGLCVSVGGRAWIDGFSSASLPTVDSQMCFSVSMGLHSIFPWNEVLRDLCATLPLDSVTTLIFGSMYDNPELEEGTARLLVSHLRGVRTLRVEHDSVEYMLRAMHPKAGDISTAFPHLGKLIVCYGRYDESTAMDAHLLGPVTDCLVARKGSGQTAAVKELEINGEAVPSKYLENLEDLKSWKRSSSVHGTT